MSIFLLEVDAWTGSQVERLRFATKSIPTSSTDTPPNTFYDGRIVDLGDVQQTVAGNRLLFGPATATTIEIILNNGDGKLDYMLDAGFGRRMVLMHIDGSSTVVWRGTAQGIDSKDVQRTIRIRGRDRLAELQKPLLTTRYLGTTVSISSVAKAEGNADMANVLKPYSFGVAPQVPGKLVNEFVPLYQFAANEQASMVVYDGGIIIPSVGDFGSIASLIDAPINTLGAGATCLSQGIFRPRFLPAKGLTADLVEGSTLSLRSCSRISQRVLSLYGWPTADLDSDTFDTFHAFNPAEVGIYIDSDRACFDVLTEINNSVGGAIYQDNEGLLRAVGFSIPLGAAVKPFTLRDILADAYTFGLASGVTDEGDGVPVWSVSLNWGKIWQTQGPGDLNGDASSVTDPVGGLARREYLSKATRQKTEVDASVKIAHPLADTVVYDTLLVNEPDVAAETLRRLNMLKVRRDRPVVPVPFEDGRDINIGDVVSIDPRTFEGKSRFGWGLSKSFSTLGIRASFNKKVFTFDFWG